MEPITDILPLRGAIRGANRVEELTQPDRALGRMLARGGPADKLTRPGGVVDMLSEPGVCSIGYPSKAARWSGSSSPGPGGPATGRRRSTGRMFAEDGMIERLFAEEGMIERLFAEEGIVDKLTAKNGPLEQLTGAAEILSQLQPVVETLTPTAADPAVRCRQAQPGGHLDEQLHRPTARAAGVAGGDPEARR